MSISFSFVFIVILILLPGLIFRRLFFYGEFSKQFNPKRNIFNLIILSAIPGFFISLISFFIYDTFIRDVDFNEFINVINNYAKFSDHNYVKKYLYDIVLPFLSFLFTFSLVIGMTLSRLIRFFGFDTKFKLLRFKNQWFYLFSGEAMKFKKLETVKPLNKKYVFTKAEILIHTPIIHYIYSGVVLDYELKENACNELDKIILGNAKKYILNNHGKKVRIRPYNEKNLLIVSKDNTLSIDVMYIYETVEKRKKNYEFRENIFNIFLILIFFIFLFKFDSIKSPIYQQFFNHGLIYRILIYLFVIQLLYFFLPYFKDPDKNEYYPYSTYLLKAKTPEEKKIKTKILFEILIRLLILFLLGMAIYFLF